MSEHEKTTHVLGRCLARSLDDREIDHASGGHGGNGCGFNAFITDFDADANPICDPGPGQTP